VIKVPKLAPKNYSLSQRVVKNYLDIYKAIANANADHFNSIGAPMIPLMHQLYNAIKIMDNNNG